MTRVIFKILFVVSTKTKTRERSFIFFLTIQYITEGIRTKTQIKKEEIKNNITQHKCVIRFN